MIVNEKFIDRNGLCNEPVLCSPKSYFDYLSSEYKFLGMDKRLSGLARFIDLGGDLREAVAHYRGSKDELYTSSLYDTMLQYVAYMRTGEYIHVLSAILKERLSESQLIDLLVAELQARTEKEYDGNHRPVGYKVSLTTPAYDFDKYAAEYAKAGERIICGDYLTGKADLFKDTAEKLAKDNPWASIAEQIEDNDYIVPRECIHPADKRIIDEFNANAGDEHRLVLDLVPEPFQGNPLTAEVVILTLNPGFVAKCNYDVFNKLTPGRQRAFVEAKCNLLRLQDEDCVSGNEDINEVGEGYWKRKLKDLLPDANKKLAIVQYLAYFSTKYKDIPKKLFGGDTDLLYTQQYTIRLVKYLMSEGKVIVIARHPKDWYRHVPGLESYPKKVLLTSALSSYITPGNCEGNGFDLIKKACAIK